MNAIRQDAPTIHFSGIWEQPGRREPYVFTVKRGRFADHVRRARREDAEQLRTDMIALYKEHGWTVEAPS